MGFLGSNHNGAEFKRFFAVWSCGVERCWRQGRHVEGKHTCGKRRVSALFFTLSKPVLQPAATVSGEGKRVRKRVVFRTCVSSRKTSPMHCACVLRAMQKVEFVEIGRQSVGKTLRGMECGTRRVTVAYTKV